MYKRLAEGGEILYCTGLPDARAVYYSVLGNGMWPKARAYVLNALVSGDSEMAHFVVRLSAQESRLHGLVVVGIDWCRISGSRLALKRAVELCVSVIYPMGNLLYLRYPRWAIGAYCLERTTFEVSRGDLAYAGLHHLRSCCRGSRSHMSRIHGLLS